MWGKKAAPVARDNFPGGWDRRQFGEFLGRLTREIPMVNLGLTGYQEIVQLEGGRTGTAVFRHSVIGRMDYPAALVHGTFEVDGDRHLLSAGGNGKVHFSSEHREERLLPLVSFNLLLPSQDEVRSMQSALRPALAGRGLAWINFVVDPIEDVDHEVRKFEERKYSSALTIRKVYFGSTCGEAVD